MPDSVYECAPVVLSDEELENMACGENTVLSIVCRELLSRRKAAVEPVAYIAEWCDSDGEYRCKEIILKTTLKEYPLIPVSDGGYWKLTPLYLSPYPSSENLKKAVEHIVSHFDENDNCDKGLTDSVRRALSWLRSELGCWP